MGRWAVFRSPRIITWLKNTTWGCQLDIQEWGVPCTFPPGLRAWRSNLLPEPLLPNTHSLFYSPFWTLLMHEEPNSKRQSWHYSIYERFKDLYLVPSFSSFKAELGHHCLEEVPLDYFNLLPLFSCPSLELGTLPLSPHFVLKTPLWGSAFGKREHGPQLPLRFMVSEELGAQRQCSCHFTLSPQLLRQQILFRSAQQCLN